MLWDYLSTEFLHILGREFFHGMWWGGIFAEFFHIAPTSRSFPFSLYILLWGFSYFINVPPTDLPTSAVRPHFTALVLSHSA